MTETIMQPDENPAIEKPVAKFVNSSARCRTITLDYPIEFCGAVYSSVTVRRITGKELADIVGGDAVKVTKLPMFDCPLEVIDALDADDNEKIIAAVMDFLPRALRPANA